MDDTKDIQLTDKQELFCREYLVDLNATQAAIRAGYSENCAAEQGYENLRKPQIADRIAVLKAERYDRTELSADYVLEGLQEVFNRCMQKEAVTDNDGNIIEFRFEHSGANKSLELLGKHLGLFVDRKEISGFDGGPVPISYVGVESDGKRSD